jgi:hypothetical protein
MVMEEPKENKGITPGANKAVMVKVRILPKRAIAGYGAAGDVVSMPETLAKEYEREGFVEILK